MGFLRAGVSLKVLGSFFFLSFLLSSLILTIFLVNQRQELRKEAEEPQVLIKSTKNEKAIGGVYVKAGSGERKYLDQILSLPYIAGVEYGVQWKDLEPNEGNYQWSLIDEAIQKTRQKGKVINLKLIHIQNAPQWIKDRSEKFTYYHPEVGQITVPHPWDKNYRVALKKTVKALGERYNQNPGLHLINISGPTLLFGTETNLQIESKGDLQRFGYTDKKYRQGWEEMIDAFLTAFPAKHLSLTLHDQIGGHRAYLAQQIRDYTLGKAPTQIHIRLNGLSDNNPIYFAGRCDNEENITPYVHLAWDVRQKTDLGYEAIANFRRNREDSAAAVWEAVRNGLSCSPRWLTFFLGDVWDTVNNRPYAPHVPAFKYAAERLQPPTNSTGPTATPTPGPTTTPTPRPTKTPTPTPIKPTSTPTPTQPPLIGDIDGDGDVDIFDYNILVSHFGPRMPSGGSPADLDHDGDVDIFDYNLLVGNFGKKGE